MRDQPKHAGRLVGELPPALHRPPGFFAPAFRALDLDVEDEMEGADPVSLRAEGAPQLAQVRPARRSLLLTPEYRTGDGQDPQANSDGFDELPTSPGHIFLLECS